MNVEMVLATDRTGGIGKDGRLPWPHCKEDMKRFMSLSKDAVTVMGRMTYNDIAEAAKERGKTEEDITKDGILKGREAIVLSSTQTEFLGAVGMKSLREVFNTYRETDKRIVVIGGEKLFIQALTWANVVHLTTFDKVFQCDRHFPVWALKPDVFEMNVEKITPEGFDCDAYFITYTRRIPVVIQ